MPGSGVSWRCKSPSERQGQWLRDANGAIARRDVDINAARAVSIKNDLYTPATMISPDSAKVLALCAVPGQIGSGEMNMANGRTEYAIDIIPNQKKTHTKVITVATRRAMRGPILPGPRTRLPKSLGDCARQMTHRPWHARTCLRVRRQRSHDRASRVRGHLCSRFRDHPASCRAHTI
jgi:hypothetical protein